MIGQFKGVIDKIKTTGIKGVMERFEAGRRLAGSAPESEKEKDSGKGGSSAFAFYGGVLTPRARPGVCARRPQ